MTPTPETLKLALTARDQIVEADGPKLDRRHRNMLTLMLPHGPRKEDGECIAALHALNWWCDKVMVWSRDCGIAFGFVGGPGLSKKFGVLVGVESTNEELLEHEDDDFLTAKIHAVASVAERIGKDKT